MNTVFTDYLFTQTEIDVISKEAEKHNASKFYAYKNSSDGGHDTLFDVYDEEGNYLFSIDRDADGELLTWIK